MSEKSDYIRLETVLKYIEDINKIITKHDTLDNVLNDMEGQYALSMILIQIAETVNKITSEKILSKLPKNEIISFRNRIVHNYEGTDWKIVKKIILESIPDLKNIINKILESCAES
jgi:uncharacterized protein with HEPN domain